MLAQKHQYLHCPYFPYQLVYPALQRSGVIEKSGFKVGTGFRGSARWIRLPLVCGQEWKGGVSDRVISQLF